eukprot:5738030-Alexandrium_andersonii.AAC.1
MERGAEQERAEGEAQAGRGLARAEASAQQLLPGQWQQGDVAAAMARAQSHDRVEVRSVRDQPHERTAAPVPALRGGQDEPGPAAAAVGAAPEPARAEGAAPAVDPVRVRPGAEAGQGQAEAQGLSLIHI